MEAVNKKYNYQILQKLCYLISSTLAKRSFSLTSPEETCKILYRELKLPFNAEKSAKFVANSKVKPSCKKEILQKLAKFHELPKVILEWRKLNASVSKVIGPLSQAAEKHDGLNMCRIYPQSKTFTATGKMF